jgi:hypothetical protein
MWVLIISKNIPFYHLEIMIMKLGHIVAPVLLASLVLFGCEAKKPPADAATPAVPPAAAVTPAVAATANAPMAPKTCTKDSMKASVDASCKAECKDVKGKKAKACMKKCTQTASAGHDCMAHCDSTMSHDHQCQTHCASSPTGGMDKSCAQHCDGTSTAAHDCEKHCEGHKDPQAKACVSHCAH